MPILAFPFTSYQKFLASSIHLTTNDLLEGLLPQTLRADYARTRAVISPIIHADHRVTFRLNAPEAGDVRITGHVIGANAHWLSKDRSLAMTKGADGFWTITLGPLAPDI